MHHINSRRKLRSLQITYPTVNLKKLFFCGLAYDTHIHKNRNYFHSTSQIWAAETANTIFHHRSCNDTSQKKPSKIHINTWCIFYLYYHSYIETFNLTSKQKQQKDEKKKQKDESPSCITFRIKFLKMLLCWVAKRSLYCFVVK